MIKILYISAALVPIILCAGGPPVSYRYQGKDWPGLCSNVSEGYS